MSIIIDYKSETEFLSGNKELAQNVINIRKGDDYKPAEAFLGASVGPTLLRGQQDAPENDLVNSASALNQDDNKPVVGS